MNKFEKYCLNEVEATNKNTFMYKFHEYGYFNVDRFYEFINKIKNLYDYYKEHGKSDNYNYLTKLIIDRLYYIVFLFYCHENPNDLFRILNYEEIKNNVPDYMENIRKIIGELII